MLCELKIRNLAVVEDAVIPFDEGLNVLTGSTGAGKSIILSAVDLLSGSRAKRSMIRRGADSLAVEGTFRIPPEAEIRGLLGMEPDDEVSIKRELGAGGKSKLWINGMLSTAARAREVTQSIFELHGQHRQQELLDPATHVLYLDARGDYEDVLIECASLTAEYRRIGERIAKLRGEERRHREQEEFYRFQLAELEKLDLEPGLDGELERRIRLAENRHRYVEALEECRRLLEGDDGSIIGGLTRLEERVRFLGSLDDRWADASRGFDEFRITMQEISRSVEQALGGEEAETVDLEALQMKLAAIQRVARKLDLDCAGLIERREELKSILASLTDGSGEIDAAERRLREVAGRLIPVCVELGERRRRTAAKLDREVTEQLKRLGIKGAEFKTSVSGPGKNTSLEELNSLDLTSRGWDRVEFMIRTNVGEDMHPLADVASGGELSRITLVLKTLQAAGRSIPTLIFDEVDTGLGADLGEVVAERMQLLSRRYQIVCITHLPQIAARARQHIRVDKRVKGGRTVTTASVIDGDGRIEEIARMLGGAGELRKKLAGELLGIGNSARSSAG